MQDTSAQLLQQPTHEQQTANRASVLTCSSVPSEERLPYEYVGLRDAAERQVSSSESVRLALLHQAEQAAEEGAVQVKFSHIESVS